MLAMLQSMSSWPPLDHCSTCRAVGNLTIWKGHFSLLLIFSPTSNHSVTFECSWEDLGICIKKALVPAQIFLNTKRFVKDFAQIFPTPFSLYKCP